MGQSNRYDGIGAAVGEALLFYIIMYRLNNSEAIRVYLNAGKDVGKIKNALSTKYRK
ncbi:MAG TPA: hypothetical protein PLV43_11980 [Aequorivita sp.]|nr:hypothetical protein [Aequorivita sp.]